MVDAFIDVRRGDSQHIVRSSAPLADRGDLSVGPFRIEVLEPLRRLRVVVEPTEHHVAMDVTWEGHIPAVDEPRQYMRSKGKVVFDTQRLAQTGRWSGTLSVGGADLAVTPDRCWGTRDRSWGVRPVGEPESDGIRQGELVLGGMWNYFPMQFDDHAIMYICHERDDGERPLVQAERVWVDPERGVEDLGRSEHEHHLIPGTRVIDRSVVRFPEAGLEVTCTPLLRQLRLHRHRLRHRRRLAPRHVPRPRAGDPGPRAGRRGGAGLAQYGIVDHVAEFSYDGQVGYGLLEHGFFGPYRRYGLLDGAMGAPAMRADGPGVPSGPGMRE